MRLNAALACGSLLFAVLAGCGSGIRDSGATTTAPTIPIVTYPPAPAGKYVKYHAYGDSITAGSSLLDPGHQAYPALVATDRSLTLVNSAIPGDQACDVPTRQIFAHADSPSLTTPPLYSLLIGTNDVDIKGTGAYETIFNLCQQASIAWLAVPSDFKVLANSSSVTSKGGGSLDASNHWNAWVTAAQGSSVSFAITTTQAGPIYAWPRIDDNNAGTYSYALDGVVLGTGVTQTTPRIATANGTTNSLGFLRIPNVSAGAHIVTFTQTSSAANGLSIVGIGAPQSATQGNLPTMLVGTVPFQQHDGGGGACTSTDAPCLQYIRDMLANVAVFTGDGLDVRIFDTRKYMFGTASEMNDSLHPNVLGHIELSHSVEAVF